MRLSRLVSLETGVKRRVTTDTRTGRSYWVVKIGDRWVSIKGKVKDNTFFPENPHARWWIMKMFRPQRTKAVNYTHCVSEEMPAMCDDGRVRIVTHIPRTGRAYRRSRDRTISGTLVGTNFVEL